MWPQVELHVLVSLTSLLHPGGVHGNVWNSPVKYASGSVHALSAQTEHGIEQNIDIVLSS